MDIAFSDYMRFMFALIFVLGLILGAAVLAKRFGFGNQAPMRLRGAKRLSVVESIAIDTRRRLVLVRRDQTEYLLLVGGTTELLVDSAIPSAPSLPLIEEART